MKRILAVAITVVALCVASAHAEGARTWSLTQRKDSHVLTYGAPGDLGIEFSCKAGGRTVAITVPGQRKIFLRLRSGAIDDTIMSKLSGGLRTGHMKTSDPLLAHFRATWSVQVYEQAPYRAETDSDRKAIAAFFDICPPR